MEFKIYETETEVETETETFRNIGISFGYEFSKKLASVTDVF